MIAKNPKDRAEQNRKLVAQGIGNEFYDQQAKICQGWALDRAKPPPGVVVGELPYFALSPLKPSRLSIE